MDDELKAELAKQAQNREERIAQKKEAAAEQSRKAAAFGSNFAKVAKEIICPALTELGEYAKTLGVDCEVKAPTHLGGNGAPHISIRFKLQSEETFHQGRPEWQVTPYPSEGNVYISEGATPNTGANITIRKQILIEGFTKEMVQCEAGKVLSAFLGMK